ncbi:hypothetical protein [Parasphingorhabdus sp.]
MSHLSANGIGAIFREDPVTKVKSRVLTVSRTIGNAAKAARRYK